MPPNAAAAASSATASSATASAVSGRAKPIPFLYRLFFLYIEPVATAAGAYYAWFGQDEYLHLTQPGNLLPASLRESTVLGQLANLYACFALNEALVLRSTNDLVVWRTFLFGLLLADFGHLAACSTAGLQIYWSVWDWNAIDYGNLAFVYVGASFRMAFLLGLGLGLSNAKAD